MSTKQSGLTRYMKGRLYPGGPSTSKVRDITYSRDGKMRIVHLANGTSLKETKATVLRKFQQVLSADQKAKSLRSMRKTPTGKVAVTIGGAKKGERKLFATSAAAKAAVTRHYRKHEIAVRTTKDRRTLHGNT